MPLNDTLLNVGANAMAAAATHLSLATANPEPTGSNQATSGRVAAGWGAAATGDLTVTNKAFTGGAANGPCTYVCLWSAITGGTFYGSVALTGDTTFNSAGEYTITSLTVNGSST
jgi:hypothetical protein